MSEIGQLQVKVTADTSPLTRKIAEDGEKAGSSLGGKIAKGFGVAAAGIGVAAAGGFAVFAKGAVDAARESEVAQARLDAVAKSMGFVEGAYAGATQRAKDYAAELSRNIGVEDETINAVQAKLLTFKEIGKTVNDTNGVFDRATKAAFDLAKAGFGEAASNATQLGKALQDPTKGIAALGRAGVTFTDAEKDKIKALQESGNVAAAQEIVLKSLEAQVGGVAEATATSADKMKVAWGELQESVGNALLPVVNELMDTLTPVIDDLQGPLSEIAGTIGNTLGTVLKEVTPLIAPLATALAQIGGAVSGALASTLSAVLPAITPILTALGEFGTRLGPLLEKVLGKVGELLARVLDAVVPLLEPLMDLVFTILDAAWPIIEVVADAFLILVDAVKPLLGAVIALVQPLGQLVSVALAAVMPIIQPLLPLIEALATVLADVLGRAIGLITTAIGYLIIAFSKVAPFVANNLVKPVVSLFLTFAENIVNTAAEAFGWVPGLGDKLNTAKDAIGKFKTDATRGIEEAASKISTEGEKIGKGLVDQGLAAMKDPANQNKYAQAGTTLGTRSINALDRAIQSGQVPVQAASRELGTYVAAGMGAGITANSATATAATKTLAANVTNTAKTELGVRSPSTVFAGIGGFVVQGLRQGIENAWSSFSSFWSSKIGGVVSGAKNLLGIASPSKVFMEIGGNVVDGFEIGIADMDKVPEKLREPLQKMVDISNDKIREMVDQVKADLDEAKEAFKDYQQAAMNVLSGGMNVGDAWRVSTDSTDRMNDAFKELERAKADLARAQAAGNTDTTSEQNRVTEANAAYEAAKGSVVTFEQAWADQIAKVNLGRDVLGQLNAQIAGTEGGAMLMQQLFAMPLDQATMIAQNLLGTAQNPDSLLGRITTDLSQQSAWNGAAATQWAQDAKGAGVEQALSAVKGIRRQVRAERENLIEIGKNMGDGLVIGFKAKESAFKGAVRDFVNATRAELGIASPSKVFQEIGKYTAQGFNVGVDTNLEPISPTVNLSNPRVYAPGLTAQLGGVGPVTDVKVFLGDKELTDLVDVQIQSHDQHQADLIIAGRRF